MKFKIFTKILFEQKKILILYVVIIIFSLTFLNMRFISINNNQKQSRIPDIVVKGKMDDDGELKYKYYNDMANLVTQLEGKLSEKTKIYGITTRSLMTDRDPLTNNSIEYTIYGVSDDFFVNEIKGEIKSGKIPQSNEFQIVMGNYAKEFYKVDISDKIEQPITLNKDWTSDDIGLYSLSGILNDNLSFFKGAVFLSKETFENSHQKINDNSVFIYVENQDDFDEALGALQELKMNDTAIGTINMNFYMKRNSMRNALIGGLSITMFAVIIIIMLMTYLMKGTSRKLGILKALGMPSSDLIFVFCGGLSITLLLSAVFSLITTYLVTVLYNISLSKFLGYRVSEYNVSFYCVMIDILFVLICAIISFLSVYRLTNRTLPKSAMKQV